jgi:nitric oxide reductase NorD protein
MSGSGGGYALQIERSCALVASAFSGGCRQGVRLMSGEQRCFGVSTGRSIVNVPYPALAPDWTLRTLTCGVALQCAPSKDLLAQYPLHQLTSRQLQALAIVEGEVALGWVISRWPGLLLEFRRLLPEMIPATDELDAPAMFDRAQALARSSRVLSCHPVFGQLPLGASAQAGLLASLQRLYGQMPWNAKRPLSKTLHTIPVGGQGGAKNPNLPPPSRPEQEDPEIRTHQRAGIPYPEWNAWKEAFLLDHVAVLERKLPSRSRQTQAVSTDLRRWFEEHTHRAMKNRLEDGSDLDIDQYINYHVDTMTGKATEARVFRDLLPASRDVTTAVLLDGSSSLGAYQGHIFHLELACADALSRAMTLARERHGLFVFSGNTRHRVDVVCLKDFADTHSVMPSSLGLVTGGYTRLGAPLRHLTSRLLQQHSERRLLIVIGDGLMSDEGYEGKYAWADVAHAIGEADDAGVSIYYIGVGPVRVDPLPDVFGARRSKRIKNVEELPRVLAHVHRELVAA